jgi:hypothetical protein
MEYKFATREELSVEETVQAVISELEESWRYRELWQQRQGTSLVVSYGRNVC